MITVKNPASDRNESVDYCLGIYRRYAAFSPALTAAQALVSQQGQHRNKETHLELIKQVTPFKAKISEVQVGILGKRAVTVIGWDPEGNLHIGHTEEEAGRQQAKRGEQENWKMPGETGRKGYDSMHRRQDICSIAASHCAFSHQCTPRL